MASQAGLFSGQFSGLPTGDALSTRERSCLESGIRLGSHVSSSTAKRNVTRNGRLCVRACGTTGGEASTSKPHKEGGGVGGGFLGRLSKSLLSNPQLNERLSDSLAQKFLKSACDIVGTESIINRAFKTGEDAPTLRRPKRGNHTPPFCPTKVYISNDRSLLNVDNVSKLWACTLDRRHMDDPSKIQMAIDHSYEVAIAVTYPEDSEKPRLVGLARSMSDGAFVATICDVAVLPEWQGKGYGLRLVRYLLNRMREGTRIGDVGPSSFAVFPKPSQREFFYKCGFRLSHRFIMMKFTKETAPPMASEALRPTIQLILAENGKIVADFDAIA